MLVSKDEERTESEEWKQSFLFLGGLQYLFDLLLSTNFWDVSFGSRRYECLLALLRVINYFCVGLYFYRFSLILHVSVFE